MLGIRPEDLEDAALVERRARRTSACAARSMLREALGSEIVVHFEIDAPPVLTEDTRELAEDIGTAHQYEAARRARQRRPRSSSAASTRARRCARARPIEVAVDTRALHFFDLETGLGIYDEAEARETSRRGRAMVGSHTKEADDHETTRDCCLASSWSWPLAAFAVGCGGDDDERHGAGIAEPPAAADVTRQRLGDGRLDRRRAGGLPGGASTASTSCIPNVTVKYTSAGDQLPTVLSTAVQGGNPPDIAARRRSRAS